MFLVGIAGGSGSGKTTFTRRIFESVVKSVGEAAGTRELGLLHQDSYYLDRLPEPLLRDGNPNFDHPEAFDWNLLRAHLEALKAGGKVAVPHYDYTLSRRRKEATSVGPCRAMLVEGIYTLWKPEIRELFDVRVYLHVDADIRFIRRLHRDIRERGRTNDGIIRQYYDTVRPMHHEFLEPTRAYADLVVGEETEIAAEVIAARVAQVLARGGRAS